MWLISFFLLKLQRHFSCATVLRQSNPAKQSSVSLCSLGCDAHSKQLVSSLNQHGDLVAAADGLVDLFGGVHLCSVYLHHDVS